MEETIYCCGYDHRAKVYNLPSKRGRWKKLYFLDECPFCGNSVCALWQCNDDGMLKLLARKTNTEALRLRDKLIKFVVKKEFRTRQGSFSNEIIYYNNKGDIFNFNNYKVGKNADFCMKRELLEING